jgi:hypothetical protein
MLFKIIKTASITALLLTTTFAVVAHAQTGGGEGGGNAQSPAQVIVQIVVTAVVLRILSYFNLP